MKQFVCAICLLATLTVFAGKIKFIDLSWHCPDVGFLEQYLEEIEETTPLDGLTIAFEGTHITVDGEEYIPKFWNAWANVPWKYEYFEDFVERMNKLKFRKCKDNFLYLTTNEAKFDWFSDKDWKIITANFGIAAKLAKKAGLKGFLFDLEEYGMRMWPYDARKAGRPIEEALQTAFARGQQWGKAVFKEFPNIIIFMPFAFSIDRSQKGLAGAFLNGILDVMPSSALMYEGDESFSYRASNPQNFAALRTNLEGYISKLVYTPYRKKAEKQMKLSPGFYIDAYFYLPPDNHWVKCLQPELDAAKNRVAFFCDNLKSAMEVADEYVWFYSEYRCWWKHSTNPKYNDIWDDAPDAKGLTEAIRVAQKEF